MEIAKAHNKGLYAMLKISQPKPSYSKNAKATLCIFGEKIKYKS